MIKYIFLLLLLISANRLYSQKNVLVEYKYIQLVNAQGDEELAQDNYRNAEIICDSIISNFFIYPENAYLFFELAKSYELNDEYGMMAFSLLRQRCLAPNDSFNTEGERMFEEASLRLQMTHIQSKKLYNDNMPKKITDDNYQIYLANLYQSSIFLFDPKVDGKLMNYYSVYNTQKVEIDSLHRQWHFLTMIDLGMKKKKKILTLISKSANKKEYQTANNKLYKRELMRAEHYYRKSGANAEAKYYLEEYKKQDLNIFNKIQRSWRLLLN